MKKIVTTLILGLTILGFSQNGYAQAFKHPGIYSSMEQLEFVKQKVQQGEQPWKKAYDELLASNPTTRAPKAYADVPGSSAADGRKELDNMTYDASHAYASALLFYFTGEKKYAEYTINVLNTWSIYMKSPHTLYLTWAAPHFINAAELMKHLPGTGWKSSDIQKFSKMVNDRMWPRVGMPATDAGSNGGCTAIESQFAIAIFLDDRAKFNEAVDNAKWILPKWIFMNDKRPGVYNGETANTCRDLSHTRLGTIGLAQALHSAWNQGVDLWKPNQARWIAFAELHAGMMTGEKPVPNDMCRRRGADRRGVVFCDGKAEKNWKPGSDAGLPPCQKTAWEIIYNHIATRLGNPLPISKRMTESQRPFGEISRRANKWETLIHANINPANIGVVTPPGNVAPTVTITSPADNGTFELGQTITLSADANDSDGTINNVNFRIDDEFYNYDGKAPFNASFTPTKAGTYKISAVASDDKDAETEVFVTITVTKKNEAPTGSFTSPASNVVTLEEGYTELYIDVEATDPENGKLTLTLWIDGKEIRSESVAPYEWGHKTETVDFTTETLGLKAGDHELEVRITDEKGATTIVKKNVVILEKVVTGTSRETYLEHLTAFPNPSNSGVFQLSVETAYEVHSLTGQYLFKGNSKNVDLSSYPKGIYLLRADQKVIQLVK